MKSLKVIITLIAHALYIWFLIKDSFGDQKGLITLFVWIFPDFGKGNGWMKSIKDGQRKCDAYN